MPDRRKPSHHTTPTTGSTTGPTTGSTTGSSTGTGATTVPAVPAGPSASTLGLLAIGNDEPQHLGDVRPYRYVALQHWFGDVVDRIHATSPTTQTVAYFEAAAVRDQDCATAGYATHVDYDSAPVNYCWVQRNHPEWFLRDSTGRPLHFADYPEYVAIDVSQPAYRQLWLDNAVQLARANHFDGILFDDILIGVSHDLSGRIAGWTDQQYGNAMADFGSWIGDHLRAAGLVAMANAGIDPWVPWEVTAGLRLAAHVDVLNREFTVRWGSCGGYSPLFTDPASAGNPPLSMIEDFQRQAQSAGAALGSVDYVDTNTARSDVATMIYGRASFLLTWDGTSRSAYFLRTCDSGDPAAAPWMAEPGTPTSGIQQRGGLWVRTFTGGAVVLNPSSGTAAPLPTELSQGYVDSTGRATTPGQSVPAHSALVLLGGTASTVPPAPQAQQALDALATQ